MSLASLSSQQIHQKIIGYDAPLYFYDFNRIDEQVAKLDRYLPDNFRLHYTLKANSNLAVCQHLANLGVSADISSIGELATTIKAGFAPEKILFTGPGKTRKELSFALKQGIGLIVIESVNEARLLNSIAQELGIQQDILVRINPGYRSENSCDVSQGASASCEIKVSDETEIPVAQLISASASKFGVDEAIVSDTMKEIVAFENLNLKGIHIFTESNLVEYEQLIASCQNTINIANRLADEGYPISTIDFGGGMGIPYNDVDPEFDVEAFGKRMQEISDNNPYDYQFIFELGRYVVCSAGSYVTEILDIKESQGKKFFILNGGVHQMLRLSMRTANKYMDIIGKDKTQLPTEKVTFAGKLPTPLDIMCEDVDVPTNVEIGDRIIIYNCGAYGFNHSMTNFTLHNYPMEVAHYQGEVKVIRDSGKVEDFFVNQNMPFGDGVKTPDEVVLV